MKNTLSKPFFSVIVATYNSDKTLDICLQSIIAQKKGLVELLIVDGASTDNTIEIINKYKKHIRVTISEPDSGVYDAWNKLLAEIKGKWTLFLGSDDCFSSNNSLLNLYEKINNEKYNNYDFIFSKVRLVDSIITRSPYEVLGDKDLKYYQSKLKNEMLFSHTGCLHRSTLFNMGLRFDNSYKIAGDYEFVLRAINLDITKVGKYDDILLDMGQGGLSTGSLSRVKTNIEAIKARISNGLLLPSPRLFYRLLLSLLCLFISKFFGETALTKTANLYRFLIGKNKRTSFK